MHCIGAREKKKQNKYVMETIISYSYNCLKIKYMCMQWSLTEGTVGLFEEVFVVET